MANIVEYSSRTYNEDYIEAIKRIKLMSESVADYKFGAIPPLADSATDAIYDNPAINGASRRGMVHW